MYQRGEAAFVPFAGTEDLSRSHFETQDAIELADALGFDRFAVVGHDWGARTAYTMGALFPERLSALAALSVGYQPRGLEEGLRATLEAEGKLPAGTAAA